MATTGMQDDVMKQAQHLWSMLDELAESDGDAYKKFVEQNLQKGREELATPQPWHCVKTRILRPHKETLFINICGWSRITGPQTPTEAIKVTAGPVEDGKDDTGVYKVVRVAFNPDVLEECGKNSQEQDMLIGNAIDYLQDQKKLRISSNFQLCQGVAFKGDPKALRDFFNSQPRPRQHQEQDDLITKLTPDSLLSHLRVSDNNQSQAGEEEGPDLTLPAANGGPPVKERKAGLIEELSSTDVGLPCPEFGLSLREADTKRLRRLIVRIEVPGVHSVADCELDITEDELSLLVPDMYKLHLPLPETILEDKATAKFNNTNSSLTVTMPTGSSKT